MNYYPIALAALLTAVLCGCSESGEPTTEAEMSKMEKKREGALIQMQIQSLDQAKGVEKTLQFGADEDKKSIDKLSSPEHKSTDPFSEPPSEPNNAAQ